MKLKLILGALLLTGMFAGCASNQKWQAEQIPYPRSTPFDSNEFARLAYLEGFRMGYRAETSGGATNMDTLTEPHKEARRLGYYAGAGQAKSEKAAATKGVK